MKRVFYILAAIGLLVFGACRNPFIAGNAASSTEGGTGSLTVSVVQSRSIIPDVDMDISYYEIYGSGPSDSFGPVPITDTTYSKDDLAVGEWTITVDAYNISDELIGSGEATGTVTSGSSTSFAVTVGSLSGDGAIDITITWPSSTLSDPEITATLSPVDGATANIFFSVSGDTASYSTTEAVEGYSLLIATVTDGSFSHTFMESILVYSGFTTWADLEITSGMIVDDIVPVPEASPEAGIYSDEQTVSLSCSQSGVTIYYSLNGSVPNEEHGTEYTSGDTITIGSTSTLKAAAVASSGLTSEILTAEYTIEGTMARPQVDLDAGVYYEEIEVGLSCATADAKIYYTTNGDDPTQYSTPYTSGDIITISADTILKAFARDVTTFINSDSDIMTAEYTITGYVGRPGMDLDSGTYEEAQTLTLTPAIADSTIMYTTDGTDPSETNGTEYSEPISISGSMTVKAVGIKENYGNSSIVSRIYNFDTEEVTTSLEAGTYKGAQSVELSCITEDAAIYYTIDDTDPDEDSILYLGPITLEGNTTLKAVAVREDWTASSVLSLEYLLQVEDPVFSADPGNVLESSLILYFSSPTEDVMIYHTSGTTEPADPTTSDSSTLGALIESDTIIKLMAVKDGWENSDVISGSYFLGNSEVSPSNGGTVFSMTPTLSWNGTADNYEIQIASSSDFAAENIVEENSSVSGSEYECTETLTDGNLYYWQVRASGASTWSGPWSFTVNPENYVIDWEGLSPEDGGTTADTSPLFDWEPVDGASFYQVRYAVNSTALSSLTDEDFHDVTGGVSEYQYPAFLSVGTMYAWQVRAMNGDGVASEWCAAQTFNVAWPVSYTGLSPEDGETISDFTPLLEWDAVDGAVSYKIRTAEDSLSVSSADPVQLPEGENFYQIETAMILEETLWWNIIAVNEDGIEAAAGSAAQSFTTDWTPELIGVIPSAGGQTFDDTPLIQWDDVEGAVSYELRYASTSGGLDIVATPQYQDTVSEYQYSETLGESDELWWQVRATNDDGVTSQWSTALSFTYTGTPSITGQSPADAEVVSDSTPLLEWDSIGGAVLYRVKIADTAEGLDSVTPVTVTDSEYQYPYNLAGGDTLYWQVEPVDEGDTLGDAYSDSISFSIDGGAIPTDSLVLEYLFDGDLSDTSGNALTGTAYGNTTLTADRNDEASKAYYFDGSGDYIYSPSISIDWSAGFTLSVWARWDSYSGLDYSAIVTLQDTATTGFGLNINDSTLCPDGWASNGSSESETAQSSEVVSGWTHYILIANTDSIELYVDGKSVAVQAFSGPLVTGTAPVYIGDYSPGYTYDYTYDWQGAIDDIRIYNRELTQAEIYALADE